MANSDYTADKLLLAIKRRTFMPTAQIAFQDSELLSMADEEQRTYVLPFIRGINEEHLLYKQTYTLDGSTTSWLLPPGASGEALRSVEITNSNGDFIPWARVEPGQEQKTRTGFYIDDEMLVSASVPPPSGSLRVRYWRRPGKLITDTTRFGIISPDQFDGDTAVNGKLKFEVLTANTTNISVGSSLQFVEAGPGFRTLHAAKATVVDTATEAPSSLITIDTAFPTGVDFTNCYVCLSDESPVPQVPLECHALLAQRVAAVVIESRRADGLDTALQRLAQMKDDITVLMADRTQQEQRHVQNFYGPGWKRFRARRLLP